MKDYYAILEVRRGASLPEIKRAFRRMANLYHPDHNASPEAEAIIKEVIEAYQILEDPDQRAAYDQLLTGSYTPVPATGPAKPRHRDPRYRPRSVNPNYKSDNEVVMELIHRYSHVAFYVSSFTFCFCLILFIDFSLRPGLQQETVVSAANVSRSRNTDWRVYTEEGNGYSVDQHAIGHFRPGSTITTLYSPLLHVPFSLTNVHTHHETDILATVYRHFIFAPVVLMISSLLGISIRKALTFRFNLAIMNFLVFIITAVFLLISRCHVV